MNYFKYIIVRPGWDTGTIALLAVTLSWFTVTAGGMLKYIVFLLEVIYCGIIVCTRAGVDMYIHANRSLVLRHYWKWCNAKLAKRICAMFSKGKNISILWCCHFLWSIYCDWMLHRWSNSTSVHDLVRSGWLLGLLLIVDMIISDGMPTSGKSRDCSPTNALLLVC